MNRRGNLGDGAYIGVELFGLAIGILVTLLVINEVGIAVNAVPGATVAQGIMTDAVTVWPQIFDLWFASFFIGAPLVSAALAYFNNIPPLFFFLSIGYSMFQVVLGKALELAYENLVSTGDLAIIAQSIPMTNYILSNYALYAYLVIVIIAVGTFAKLGVGRDSVGGLP